MVDRSVSIGLEARVTGFLTGIRSAQAAVSGFTAELEKSAKKRQALSDLGSTAGKIGLLAAAGFGAAVLAAANFDQAMSRVQGATGESAKNMELLRTAAINAGRDTVFSASDAASAEEEMAKAGVKTADILGGGLTGALNLASAGTLDVGQAAEIAATTMNQFGLAGDQVTHIADVLAATAGKAQGDVTDMATALKYAGPVASQMGVSLEETAGSIGFLASQGVLGSQAGTSLRGMLTALTSPSKAAAKEMDTLGITMYDAKGNFIGLDGVAGQLHSKMSGLSNATRDQALGQIFGNQQITTARILYAGGAKAVDQWTKKVNDSGYAARLAATKMDNLKGDLEQLKGSLETALIGTGSGAQAPFRGVVQGLTKVVNAYSSLPPAAQGAVAKMLGITALLGGGAWLGTKVISGIVNTQGALKELGVTAGQTRTALSGIGKGVELFVIVEGLRALSDGFDSLFHQKFVGSDLQRSIEALSAGSVQGTIFDVYGASLHKFGTDIATINSKVAQFTGVLDHLTPGDTAEITKASTRIHDLDEALAQMVESGNARQAKKAFDQLLGSAYASGHSADEVRAAFTQYGIAVDNASGSSKHATDALSPMAGALNGIIPGLTGVGKQGHAAASGMSDAAASADAFKSALAGLKGLLDIHDALRNTEAAFDDFRASFKHIKGDDFNIDVKAGRDNQAKLEAIVRNAGEAISHMKDVGRASAYADHTADRIKALAKSMHLPQAETDILIAKLHALGGTDAKPPVKVQGIGQAHRDIEGVTSQLAVADKQTASPNIKVLTNQANAAINGVLQRLGLLHDKYINVNIHTSYTPRSGTPGGKSVTNDTTMAGGGEVRGPGTKTSDSVPIWGSDGEFMMKAAAVDKYGVGFMHRVNSLQLAAGGSVSRQTAWSGGGSGSVRLAGPVEIRGKVDLDTGRLVGTMRALARQEYDDAVSFDHAMAGGRSR